MLRSQVAAPCVDDFAGRFQRRSDGATFGPVTLETDDEADVELGVTPASGPMPSSGVRGSVSIRSRRVTVRRELTAASCDEAADALVIVALIALERYDVSAAPSTDGGSERDAGGERDAGAETKPPSDAGPRLEAGLGSRSSGPAQPSPDASAQTPPAPTPRDWRIGVSAHSDISFRMSSAVVALGGYVRLDLHARETDALPTRTGPSFFLGPSATFDRREGTDGVHGDFQWWFLHAGACPVGAWLISGLHVGPCLGAEVGLLDARGGGAAVFAPTQRTRAWAAARGDFVTRLVVLNPFALELALGLRVPLTRDEFTFAPAPFVYRAPPLFFGMSVGASAQF